MFMSKEKNVLSTIFICLDKLWREGKRKVRGLSKGQNVFGLKLKFEKLKKNTTKIMIFDPGGYALQTFVSSTYHMLSLFRRVRFI